MILMIAAALLAQQSPEQEWHCDDPQNQAEMNMCAGFDCQRGDAELNRLWPQLIASARERDREVDRTYDTRQGYEATLRQAQRAWVSFRDEHCTWQGYEEARGGTMEPMSYGACRAAVTRARTAQLRGGEMEH